MRTNQNQAAEVRQPATQIQASLAQPTKAPSGATATHLVPSSRPRTAGSASLPAAPCGFLPQVDRPPVSGFYAEDDGSVMGDSGESFSTPAGGAADGGLRAFSEVLTDICECCGRAWPETSFVLLELRGGSRFACPVCAANCGGAS